MSSSMVLPPGVNGSYLPKHEIELVQTVLEELDVFLQRNEQKSVLLFPPLPSRFRFLIHQTTLNHPNLSTFSVGEGCARRVVVCYYELRLQEEDHQDAKSSTCNRACSRYREMENKGNRQKSKRPDKAIYVPQAARRKEDIQKPNLKESSKESGSYTTKQPLGVNCRPKVDITNQPTDDQQFVQLSKSGPPLWPPAWDETVSILMSLKVCDQDDESSADNTVVQHTDVTLQKEGTDENLLFEIKAKLKDKDVTIMNTCSDFPAYANICLDPEEFGHVIEIYDFPSIYKTADLLDAFAEYSEGGMKIQWVDNTHALAVFSNQLSATQALSIEHPILKTRLLLEGSEKAKWKAARQAEFLQPVKERPHTDTVVARRMVSRALGLKGGLKGNT